MKKNFALLLAILMLAGCSSGPKEVDLEVMELPEPDLMPELFDMAGNPLSFEEDGIADLKLNYTLGWNFDQDEPLKLRDDENIPAGLVTDAENNYSVRYNGAGEPELICDYASYRIEPTEPLEGILEVKADSLTFYAYPREQGNFVFLQKRTDVSEKVLKARSKLYITAEDTADVQPIPMKIKIDEEILTSLTNCPMEAFYNVSVECREILFTAQSERDGVINEMEAELSIGHEGNITVLERIIADGERLTAAETPTAAYLGGDGGYEPRLYLYDAETETFYIDKQFDKAACKTYGDLAAVVAEALSLPEPEYHSMTVDFSTLIVRWSEDFYEELDKLDMRETFLQSYSMTLQRLTQINQFRYFSFKNVQAFQLKELKLNGWDKAAYDKLRASIPYVEPENWSDYEYRFAEQFPVDEMGQEIARIAEYIGIPTSPMEGEILILPEQILFGALLRTESVSVFREETDVSNYHPEALPIAIAVDDSGFYFKEHVEATARWIFGPDTELEHQEINKFGWFEEAGTYRPPHMNLGRSPAVALLSYEDKGDTVEAIVAGVGFEDYGDNFVNENYEPIPQESLKEAIENQLPHYKLTLRKGGVSGLYFESLVRAE